MNRITPALITALVVVLAIGGGSAFSEGAGVAQRGFEEEVRKEPLFNYYNGENIKPKSGVYEGKIQASGHPSRNVSFVVADRNRPTSNTGEAIYDFKVEGVAYKTSETSVWRNRYDPDETGRRHFFYETFFSNCDFGPNSGNLGDHCIAGRWADDDVVVGSLPIRGLKSSGFLARWVRPAVGDSGDGGLGGGYKSP
jgi:hypothetical protein